MRTGIGVSRRLFLQRSLAGGAALVPWTGRPVPLSDAQDRTDDAAALPDLSYVDGLSFLPPELDDLGRSGLDAFLLDVSAGERIELEGEMVYRRTFAACDLSIQTMKKRLEEGAIPGAYLATKGEDILAKRDPAHPRHGKVAIFLQFQGCDPLDEDLSRLDHFHALGLRVLQITHHFDNAVGGGALVKEPRGLTDFGHQVIARMNEIGLIPDLSHASDPTALEVLELSRRPVILSHGGARALCDNARCAPDEVIRGIGESGGVFGIFMMSFWLTEDPVPEIEHLVRQIRHVHQVGGIEAVGIANDYTVSGETSAQQLDNDNARIVELYHPWWKGIAAKGIRGFDRLPKHVVIPELNDVHRMRTIHRALRTSGFKPSEIEKIMGGNWIRVLTECLG